MIQLYSAVGEGQEVIVSCGRSHLGLLPKTTPTEPQSGWKITPARGPQVSPRYAATPDESGCKAYLAGQNPFTGHCSVARR